MKQSHAWRWLLAGVIVFGLSGWAITGLQIYARMAYMGMVVVAATAIWAVVSVRGIKLTRQTRNLRGSMGEVFEEHFEIQNKTWPGCHWLEIINQSNLPQAGGSRLLTRIGAHQRRIYTARTMLSRRGAFLLGPTRLSSGDPFGLFTIQKILPGKDTLVVLPMAVQIKDFPPPPGILPGGKVIRQRSADVTPHAAGVREYVPGDPMKRIHWPTTAHKGRLMVKEFEQDPQADIWIFLDAHQDVQVRQPEPEPDFIGDGLWLHRPKLSLPRDTFEYGISITASLAEYFLQDRRAVGLACATGKLTLTPAERGERQVNKIMETLAYLQPDGKLSILGLVMMRAKLLPIGTGVILVTPSTHPELLLAVEDLLRRHLSPVVVLIKPETFKGEGDSGTIVNGLLNRNIPVCPVNLGDDLSTQLALPVVYFQRSFVPKSYFNAKAL